MANLLIKNRILTDAILKYQLFAKNSYNISHATSKSENLQQII